MIQINNNHHHLYYKWNKCVRKKWYVKQISEKKVSERNQRESHKRNWSVIKYLPYDLVLNGIKKILCILHGVFYRLKMDCQWWSVMPVFRYLDVICSFLVHLLWWIDSYCMKYINYHFGLILKHQNFILFLDISFDKYLWQSINLEKVEFTTPTAYLLNK